MQFNALIKISSRQYGCISHRQALEVMTQRQFEALVYAGLIERTAPGTYVVAGTPSTWEQRAMVAALSIPGSVLSHGSAAKVLGLTLAASNRIELTGPRNGAKSRGNVTVHRSQQLEAFTDMRNSLPITNVPRTLIDLSANRTTKQAGALIDQACNMKLVTLAEIDHCLDRMITRGRSRVANVREALANRDIDDEKLDSFLERRVRQWIKATGLPKTKSQFRLWANGSPYRLDLAYPEFKIAVEPDGPHHLLPSIAAYDRRRDADLALCGWIVFHVYLEMEPDDLIPNLRLALHQRQAA